MRHAANINVSFIVQMRRYYHLLRFIAEPFEISIENEDKKRAKRQPTTTSTHTQHHKEYYEYSIRGKSSKRGEDGVALVNSIMSQMSDICS